MQKRLILLGLPWAIGAAAYAKLPEHLAPHWRIGPLDWWAGRELLACTLPITGLAVYQLFEWMARVDPRRTEYTKFASSRDTILNAVLMLLLGIHATVLGGALAPVQWLGTSAALIAGGTLIVVGNELPKLRRNWLLGIRTPWALDSPTAWQRTHLAAGYLTVLTGAAVVGAAARGSPYTGRLLGWGMVGTIAVSALWSYHAARKNRRSRLVPLVVALMGAAAAPRALRAQAFQAFFDSIVPAQLRARGAPGGAVVLVKDGAVVVEQGYGYANVAAGRAADARTTLFRIASISKPFVAVAVLQLAEAGKLGLHDDVGRYLPELRLDGRAGWRPITAADLLTHTAGLDERLLGTYTRFPSKLEPLSAHLARRLPSRVLPPGEIQSYSNYGYALLGLLVERVSGLSLEEYAQRHIFKPLAMARATFAQPPSGASANDVAVSYRRSAPLEPVYAQLAPAGGMFATAHDMSRFVLALLNDGASGGGRLLGPTSIKLMLTRQYTPDPHVWGMTYGMTEYHVRGGERTVLKGGDLGGFSCMVVLFPERRMGLFYIANAPAGLDLLEPFAERFLSAVKATSVAAKPELAPLVHRYTGVYQSNRYPRHGATKLIRLSVQFPVRAEADGVLDRWGTKWVEVEPLLFRRLDRDEYMVFRTDPRGRVVQLLAWNGAFDRVAWYQTYVSQLILFTLFSIAFVAVPLNALWTRLRRGRQAQPVPEVNWIHRLLLTVYTLNAVFLLWFAYMFATAGGKLVVDLPGWLIALLTVPVLSSIATVALVICTVRWFSREAIIRHGRYRLTAAVTLACCFLAWLHYWNLLGYRF